jgi:hypothetical protein
VDPLVTTCRLPVEERWAVNHRAKRRLEILCAVELLWDYQGVSSVVLGSIVTQYGSTKTCLSVVPWHLIFASEEETWLFLRLNRKTFSRALILLLVSCFHSLRKILTWLVFTLDLNQPSLKKFLHRNCMSELKPLSHIWNSETVANWHVK